MNILIINGPNLNLLGTREPSIYGTVSFNDYLNELKLEFKEHNLIYYQSNHCGEIIDEIQMISNKYDALIINAGAYTHTSLALGDSLACIKIPLVEVHISNIFKRESIRHLSYVSKYANAVISGLGLYGYNAAISYLLLNAKH